MTITTAVPGDTYARPNSGTALASPATGAEANASAVSWGAIIAGAAGAAALSLILLILGTGLGLSSVSPWASQGASSTTIGLSTILWLTFTQLAAAGMGGYIAGRLRSRWYAVHTDEVYFRDTAHGFLAWSVATLATAAMLSSAIGSIVGSGLQAGGSVVSGLGGAAASTAAAAAGGAAGKGSGSGSEMGSGYFLDSLFRKEPNVGSGSNSAGTTPPTAPAGGDSTAAAQPAMSGSGAPVTVGGSASMSPDSAATTAEVGRIFMNSLGNGSALPADDLKYVGQLVARGTGLSQQDAEKRVTDIYGRMQAKLRDAETAARDAADKARKASAYAALWLFTSLLIGAFVASWAATFGGRRRDV